jgi:hypothetical protein
VSLTGKLVNAGKAIVAFQRSRALGVSGKLDQATWNKLRESTSAPVLVEYTVTEDDVRGPFMLDGGALHARAWTTGIRRAQKNDGRENAERGFRRPAMPAALASSSRRASQGLAGSRQHWRSNPRMWTSSAAFTPCLLLAEFSASC